MVSLLDLQHSLPDTSLLLTELRTWSALAEPLTSWLIASKGAALHDNIEASAKVTTYHPIWPPIVYVKKCHFTAEIHMAER